MFIRIISYTPKTGLIKGTGSNLGLGAGFGYQYEVSKKYFYGPNSGTAGTLNKMKINGQHWILEMIKRRVNKSFLSAVATFRF
jgi:hypothetical protein